MNYIDIETVPAFKTFEEADERTQELFTKKMRSEVEADGGQRDPYEIAKELYPQKAGLFAEFNKIVCISLGTVIAKKAQLDGSISPESIYIKSFYGHEEKVILTDLSTALEREYSNLCAHFGKGFDYPVLCRKYVIHQIPMPRVLNISGLKPWEVPLHDTQEMWKFGDLRHSCSLDLLAHLFGLPSPKEEMDGSEVGHYYYNEPDGLEKIKDYCERDVKTLINVHRRINYQPIIK
jgi:hypothetical protein